MQVNKNVSGLEKRDRDCRLQLEHSPPYILSEFLVFLFDHNSSDGGSEVQEESLLDNLCLTNNVSDGRSFIKQQTMYQVTN
ncbi:hypothetical protein YC2023_042976 [Brassica napus]